MATLRKGIRRSSNNKKKNFPQKTGGRKKKRRKKLGWFKVDPSGSKENFARG